MLGAAWSKFARVEIERFHQEHRAGEIAMRSQPRVHRWSGVHVATTERHVRMECPEFNIETEREQRVVDLFSKLMQPRVPGTHARP